MKNQFYQQLETARLQERCRRCAHYFIVEHKCRAQGRKIDAAQRKVGCGNFRQGWAS